MDAVALASTVGGTAVAISGLWFTARNAAAERKARRQLAEEERQHHADRERAARNYEVRRDVYVDLLEMVFRAEETVARTEPVAGPVPAPPEPIPQDEYRRLMARAAALGSSAVMEILGRYAHATSGFHFQVSTVRAMRAQEDRGHLMVEAREELERLRQEVFETANEVERTIRAELEGLPA
jgi:hypothetical protein